jgi:hypothetical protein
MGKPAYRTTSSCEQADSTNPATEFLRVAEILRHMADELPAGTVLGNFDSQTPRCRPGTDCS